MLQNLLCALALSAPPSVQGQDLTPGCLQILDRDGKAAGMCPLEMTKVDADLAGFGARVTVKQTFVNPSKEPIEAVYTFPLPADAAVDAMNMRLGDRLVQGEIKRREEARRIYDAAKNAGMATALLDQERPNIFTQSVANIMPGAKVNIEISYVQLLKFEEDQFEFNFPMVVGPRFTGVTPDPGKVTPPITPKGTRTGAGIELTVRIDAGAPITSLESELHEIVQQNPTSKTAIVKLAKKDEIPNRDFILRYGVASNTIQSALLTYADAKNGGFFTLILMPPKAPTPEQIVPREMIFVVDQSGSQSGFPIEKSKELCLKMIEAMRPGDTFNVMGFSNVLNPLWGEPRPNTPANRNLAHQFINGIQANGGTMLNLAINAAMQPKPDPKRVRLIVFNTDGFVGDDFNILDSIQKHRGTARIFTFGIGSSVNRFLIDSMSTEGKGDSEIVTLQADTDEAVAKFVRRTQSPVLTGISAQFSGVAVADVLPSAIPDVFSEKPVILKGRYTQAGKGRIRIQGLLGDSPWHKDIDVVFPDTPTYMNLMDDMRAEDGAGLQANVGQDVPSNAQAAFGARGSAIPTLWAREMIDEVSRKNWLAMYSNQDEAKRTAEQKAVIQAVTNLGLRFGLMTQYTSFVAVEKRVINIGGKQRTVAVPVEMAEGVSYEGIFGDKLAESKSRMGFARGGAAGGPGGGFGGGGLGGGGFGGGLPASAAAPVNRPAGSGALQGGQGLVGQTIDFISYDSTDNSIVVRGNGGVTRKQFDAMSDAEVERIGKALEGEAEKSFLKNLKPAQIERYFYVKRVDAKLRASKETTLAIQIWIADLKPERLAALKAAGLAEVQPMEALKVVFGSADAKALKKLANLPFVRRIAPVEGS